MFCRVKGKGGDVIGFSGVADETPCCMGVEGYHEEECLASASVGCYGGGEEDSLNGGYTRKLQSIVCGWTDEQ